MKIGVISDTHSLPIPNQVFEAFKNVDLIIHAGDFCDLETLRSFAAVKTVKAVWGNMDPKEIKNMLPAKELIDCAGRTVGLFHGEGPSGKVLERVIKEFKKDKVDVVIFGHSHQPVNEVIDGVLYFNPGSPNDTISAPYCSYGILEITSKGIKGKIVKLQG